MNTLTNTDQIKPKHHGSVIYRALALKQQIDYNIKEIQPFYGEMQPWERKEYEGIFSQYETELKELVDYMNEMVDTFSRMLAEYGTTVKEFVSYVTSK